MSNRKGQEKVNPQKARTSDAGVKTEGTFKYALIYEAHVRLEFEKGKKNWPTFITLVKTRSLVLSRHRNGVKNVQFCQPQSID